jgi:hypothetical protein
MATTSASASARRRKALREFYKLQQQDSGGNDEPSRSGDASSETEEQQQRDVDRAVSADDYVKNLIREGDLRTLVRTENELVNEIRELESEQKTLVYNNYNKLISAANALEGMHSSSALGQFDDVRESFDKISRLASKVNATAFVRASRAPETSGGVTPGQIQTARWLLYLNGPGRKEGKLEGDVAVRLIDSIPLDKVSDSLRQELEEMRNQFQPQKHDPVAASSSQNNESVTGQQKQDAIKS